jgi:hypothetical protein
MIRSRITVGALRIPSLSGVNVMQNDMYLARSGTHHRYRSALGQNIRAKRTHRGLSITQAIRIHISYTCTLQVHLVFFETILLLARLPSE